jgi:hypothetical protein
MATYITLGIVKATFRHLALAVGGIAAAASSFFAVYVWTIAQNEDLHSRFTQTLRVDKTKSDQAPTEQDPLLRFVVNRLVPEENSAEISLLLILDTHTPSGADLVRNGGGLTAQVEDGSSADLYAAHVETEALSAAKFRSGHKDAVARSSRQPFPTFSSLDAFPFDRISLRPMFRLTDANGRWVGHNVEVQKAFPGRHMSVRWDNGGVFIEFARSRIEIAYVLGVSVVFLVATVAVFLGSILRQKTSTGLENMLSVAGLLVAAAGYREILGVAKLPSTSVLEILVLGVPILLLAISLLLSVARASKANNA